MSGLAGAQSSKPAPGCDGLAATDPEGDTTGSGAGADQYDVKGLFFDTVGSRLNVNIQVRNLTKAVKTSGAVVRWFVIYQVGDQWHYVRPSSDGTTVNYRYGTYDPMLDDFTGVGDTRGAFFEGPDGVMTIEIPRAAGFRPGGTIAKPYVDVRESMEAPQNQSFYLGTSDRGPNSGYGKDYVANPCPEPPGSTTPPPSTPAPPAGGGGGPGGQQQPAELAVTVPGRAGPAKRANRRRMLALRVTSRGKVTGLEGTLSAGRRRVGRGRLAQVNGRGTLKLKLSRALKRGAYTLLLAGTNPDGRRATRTARLRIR